MCVRAKGCRDRVTSAACHTQTESVGDASNIAAIVLAAGGSRRLGRPKQLVRVGGESLLRRAVRAASDSPCAHVLVVLGEPSAEIRAELASTRAVMVQNAAWERGVGTSIRAGVEAADALSATAVLVMLCDQPFVDAALLSTLVARFVAGDVLGAACLYAGHVGVPALLGPSLLRALRTIGDDEGARKILARAGPAIAVVAAPEAEADIDTEEDVTRLT